MADGESFPRSMRLSLERWIPNKWAQSDCVRPEARRARLRSSANTMDMVRLDYGNKEQQSNHPRLCAIDRFACSMRTSLHRKIKSPPGRSVWRLRQRGETPLPYPGPAGWCSCPVGPVSRGKAIEIAVVCNTARRLLPAPSAVFATAIRPLSCAHETDPTIHAGPAPPPPTLRTDGQGHEAGRYVAVGIRFAQFRRCGRVCG